MITPELQQPTSAVVTSMLHMEIGVACGTVGAVGEKVQLVKSSMLAAEKVVVPAMHTRTFN